MNLRLLLRSLPSSLLILRSAAWLVPAQERVEWLAEWQAELWHVWHARDSKSRGRFQGSSEVTDFCLGAFRDACWLRWNNPRVSNVAADSRWPDGAGPSCQDADLTVR